MSIEILACELLLCSLRAMSTQNLGFGIVNVKRAMGEIWCYDLCDPTKVLRFGDLARAGA